MGFKFQVRFTLYYLHLMALHNSSNEPHTVC